MDVTALVTWLIAAAVFALFLALAFLRVARSDRPHRMRRTLVLVAGMAAVVLVPAAFVAYAFYGPAYRDTLESNAVDTAGPGFSAPVRHERLAYDGVSTIFRYGGGEDALVGELEQVYPGGETSGTRWSVEVDDVTYWVEPSPCVEGTEIVEDTFC